MKNTKLKTAREKRFLTQVQVANAVGISEVAYQNYEAGERIPRADRAILIARTLNSTVEDLFGAATLILELQSSSNQ